MAEKLYEVYCDDCGDLIGKCSIDVGSTEAIYCTSCSPAQEVEPDDNDDDDSEDESEEKES